MARRGVATDGLARKASAAAKERMFILSDIGRKVVFLEAVGIRESEDWQDRAGYLIGAWAKGTQMNVA